MAAKYVCIILTVTFSLMSCVSAQCSLFTSNITTYIVNPTACSAWIACSEGMVADFGTCDSGYLYNSETQSCAMANTVKCPVTEVSNICEGLDNTAVANPADCKGYYYCVNGVGSGGLCGTGFVFNATAKLCVYQPDYDCPTSVSTNSAGSSSLCYNVPDGTVLSSVDENSACYVCYHEQSVPSSCSAAAPLEITESSDTHNFIDILLPVSALHDNHNSITISIPYNYTSICMETNVAVHFASDPGDCTGYFYCRSPDDSSPHHGYCPNGFHFEFETQRCTDSSSTKCNRVLCLGKPVGYFDVDKDSCDGFYYCSATGPVKGNCRIGYYFDVASQKCRSPEVVNCQIS